MENKNKSNDSFHLMVCRMILDAAFSELRSTEVATVHCSGLITPENVLQKLQQVYLMF